MSDKKKILLVDDDEAVVSYLVVKLAKYYDLISTTDPTQVVAMAREEQPDLILCDIDMPGMSGGDLASALTEDPDTAFIPVLYLTALVSPQETEDLQGQVGGRPGISKRAPLAQLLERIAQLAR
ncbi:MAG: two-component system response regulator [Ramlibacter sp.]